MDVDKFDLRLLAELENNARQSLSHIAKKLKSSQQVISYRMKMLEKKDIVGQYYTIIDFAKLGYTSYRTMIRLSNINETKHQEIINYCKKNGNVLWVVDCSGRWDLIVNFLCSSVMQYNSFLRDLRKKFPIQIQNYDSLLMVDIHCIGRKYLGNKETNFDNIIDNKKELDNVDLKILKDLAENARKNAVDIAEELKISPNTVVLRMKSLIKVGMIQSFKPLIHIENIGFKAYKALIKFQNITEEREKEFENFLKVRKEVVGTIKLVGAWDFEAEFEIENEKSPINFTRELRDKFSDVIREFEMLSLHREYKYNFFPGDLLSIR